MNEQRSDEERRDPGKEPEDAEQDGAAPEGTSDEAVTEGEQSTREDASEDGSTRAASGSDRGADTTETADETTIEDPSSDKAIAPASDAEESVADSDTADSSGSAESPAAADSEAESVDGPRQEAGPVAGASGATGSGRGRQGGNGGKRPGRLLAVLGILLALAASGAAGYLGWRLQQLEQRVATIPAEREAALAPLAERSALEAVERRFDQRLQEAVNAKAEALVSARDEALGSVRERLDTVEQGVASIRELAARDQVGWRLAEIRYLLAIAQRRVMIARDTRSAIAALEAADRAIAELGSVRLLPLRARIVEDLADLRAVEPADIEGIALRLQNLVGRIPELRTPRERNAGASGGGSAVGDGWWQSLTGRLDRFVTIRRRDAGPDVGRPEPRSGLPEADRLLLALERARQSALARDPAAYDRALARAEDVLAAGFDPQASATGRFAEALAYLRERPVTVDLPDLDPTVELADRLSAEIEASRELPTPHPETEEEG